MDLESSIGKDKGQKEESVDELIKKLNARGARVKILKDDETALTPKGQAKKAS